MLIKMLDDIQYYLLDGRVKVMEHLAGGSEAGSGFELYDLQHPH